MFQNNIKKFIIKLFNGATLPVFSKQLKGLRLKVDPLMPGNLFFKNVEEQVHNVYDLFIKKGFVIFDIGANVGLHSFYIAKHFENTKIFAFEPFPLNANYFREMIAINKIPNITLIESAVGKVSGECYFDSSIGNHEGHVSHNNSGLKVQMTSLDDFVIKYNLRPELIKIDVEGGESDVFDGFTKIVSFSPIIIVEIHSREQGKKVANYFSLSNYSLYQINGKNESKPFRLITELNNDVTNLYGQILAIPNINFDAINIMQNY